MRIVWGPVVIVLLATQFVAAEGRRVGDYGAPDHVLIHGCRAVPAEAVRLALLRDWEVQIASAPTASLDDYVFIIHRKVRLGFLASGFPRPEVDATADETGHVVVTIAEGPRYRCGPVHVTGAPAGTSDPIISALTHVHPPETFGVTAGQNDFRVGMDLLDDQDHPDWSVGDYAGFDTVKAGYLRDRANAALNGLGFYAAQLDASIDVEASVAVLNVTVRDSGSRAVLRHVEVAGAAINKAGEVIHYLGIRPGQAFGVDDVLRAQRMLWNSARFKSHSITATFPGANHSAIDIRIRVEELPGVPPLGQSLTPLQKAAVNCGRWLVDRCRAGDDVRVKMEAPQSDPPFSVVSAIGCDGLFAQLQSPATRPAAASGAIAPVEYAFAVTTHLAGLYVRDARCVHQSGQVLNGQVTATYLSKYEPDGSSKWNFALGAGLTTIKSGFKLHVAIAPAAMVNLVLDYQASLHSTIKDGAVEVVAPGCRIRVDLATGRLLDCSFQKDGYQIELRVGPGLAGLEAEAYDQRATGPNRYDPNAGAESVVRFWADGFWDALGRFPRLGNSSANVRPLAASLRLLGPPAASIVSGALVESTEDPDETFYVPGPPPNQPGGPFAAVLLNHIPAADKAFARESWPWTLSRQAILTYAGLTESFQPEMERMLGSNQIGPIGYLVAAKWLNRTNPRAATSLARIGLEHLTDADFALDVQALTSDGAAGGAIAKWAERLGRLPEQDAHDLAAALPAGARAPTDQFITALRTRSADPIETALPAVLQEAWVSSWREAVRKELQALAPVPLNVP